VIDAIVVGAGAAGLAAALTLRGRGLEVRVVEAGDRAGGVARTERIGGFLVERGPNSLQVKAPALAFLRSHGLEKSLVCASPSSRLRFLWHGGRLEPVPMSPVAFARTRLLSARGKLRLLAEPLVRGGDASAESVAEFLGRRVGPEAVERLVGPFLTGVYAGDERELGAKAVFGALVALERSHGSSVRGFLAQALRRSGGPRERGLRGSWSATGGLGGLAAEMASQLGDSVATSTRAVALARESGGWRIETDRAGHEPLRAARVVVALPAPEAAALVRGVDAGAADLLASIAYAPVASVSVAVARGDAARTIEGFGFLVPRDAGLTVLGCLFMSQLFPGRAPEGFDLLTCFLGGARAPEAVELPDDALLARVQDDLSRTLGLRGAARLLAVTRWPRAIAQPARDHVARIARLRARIAAHAGLGLAGSYLDGVSFADTLASGAAAGA